MGTPPLVSIIVPVYNEEAVLEEVNEVGKADEAEVLENVNKRRHLVQAEIEGIEQGIREKDREDRDEGREEYESGDVIS